MKEKIVLVLKGFIIGAGKIIPGVSGGMLAMTLNVYDKGIKAISNFFKDIKNNLTFLLSISVGILISIVSLSKVIKYALNFYYLPTMLLFIGMIIGGMPYIIKEVKDKKSLKNIVIMIIPFVIVVVMSITSTVFNRESLNEVSFITLILIGVLDAITMIIPGISGTAILMMFGYYDIIITSFSMLTKFSLLSSNLKVLIPFGLGIILGTMVLTKIINYLLENHRISSYYAIIGFALSSILLLLGETFKNNYSISEVFISLILLVIGYFISKKLDKI